MFFTHLLPEDIVRACFAVTSNPASLLKAMNKNSWNDLDGLSGKVRA